MESKNIIKKVLNISTSLITVVLLVLAILLNGVRVFGYTPYTVISGSMEPKYPVGSIVYVEQTDSEDIDIGDTITFILNEELTTITHRVVEDDTENLLFTTKGDANNVNDASPVHYKNVLGVVRYSLPLLGYISVFIASKKGIALIVMIVSIMLISSLLTYLIEDKKRKVK